MSTPEQTRDETLLGALEYVRSRLVRFGPTTDPERAERLRLEALDAIWTAVHAPSPSEPDAEAVRRARDSIATVHAAAVKADEADTERMTFFALETLNDLLDGEYGPLSPTPPSEPDAPCPKCNDMGTVDALDGEYLGPCDCPAGTPPTPPSEPGEGESDLYRLLIRVTSPDRPGDVELAERFDCSIQDGACLIRFEGEVIAMANEYGTIKLADGCPFTKDALESLVESYVQVIAADPDPAAPPSPASEPDGGRDA